MPRIVNRFISLEMFLCLLLFTEVEPQLLLNIKLVPTQKEGEKNAIKLTGMSYLDSSHRPRMLYSTIHIQEYKCWCTRHIKEPKNKEKDSNSLHVCLFLFTSALFRIQLPGSRE